MKFMPNLEGFFKGLENKVVKIKSDFPFVDT